MRLPLFLLASLFSCSLTAQSNIIVGAPAPDINVTNWLANFPADQQLKGNFLVVEFWATWCGPCLAAVPHLNDLQKKYGRADVRFVSITDEPPARTEHIIERLDFQSIVVSDTTGQTQIAFGDGVKGLEKFPLTVLIDPSNIVRWIGEPEQLTNKMMEEFLADEPVTMSAAKGTEEAGEEEVFGPSSGAKYFMGLVRDAGIIWHLDITKNEEGGSASSLKFGELGFYNEGVYLNNLFVAAMPEQRVIVPPALADIAYTVYYVNKTGDPNAWETFIRAISDELDLTWTQEVDQSPSYELVVADRTKIEPIKSEYSSTSDMEDGRVVITNFSLGQLGEKLRDYSEFSWTYTGEDVGNYAFIIDVTSAETIVASLAEYGITAKEKMRNVEVIRLSER